MTESEIKHLMQLAEQAANNAYSPYSNIQVGAALLCADGTVTCGCNIENASFGVTCCAERVALFSAIAAGKRQFSAIAVTHMPCGVCRQALAEFSPEITVYVPNENKTDAYPLSELIPHCFHIGKESHYDEL